MEPILDEHELNGYLTNILRIENWKHLFSTSPLELLAKLILRQVTRVYFHNLQIASTPLEERKVPSLAEIIAVNLRGGGGNCLHINYFMGILLKSIGYDATTIAGTIGNSLPDNHVMNVVRLAPEELYLVDVACGCPTAYPVPLHALPFTTPCCGGSTTEFRKVGDKYVKVQIGGGFFRAALDDGEREKVLITWNLTPREFASFQPGMTIIWTDEQESVFCRNLFLFRQYFCRNGDRHRILHDGEEDEKGNEDVELEFILVFGKHVLFGSGTRREIESFSSYEEMVPLLLKYFPKIDQVLLMKSIEHLKTLTPVEVRF